MGEYGVIGLVAAHGSPAPSLGITTRKAVLGYICKDHTWVAGRDVHAEAALVVHCEAF
jgi:hypothetical protein